jgi:hypothetical protein
MSDSDGYSKFKKLDNLLSSQLGYPDGEEPPNIDLGANLLREFEVSGGEYRLPDFPVGWEKYLTQRAGSLLHEMIYKVGFFDQVSLWDFKEESLAWDDTSVKILRRMDFISVQEETFLEVSAAPFIVGGLELPPLCELNRMQLICKSKRGLR